MIETLYFTELGRVDVSIDCDGDAWFVEGVDVDYLSQGNSYGEAKQHFEQGLTLTVELHQQKYGECSRLWRRNQ